MEDNDYNQIDTQQFVHIHLYNKFRNGFQDTLPTTSISNILHKALHWIVFRPQKNEKYTSYTFYCVFSSRSFQFLLIFVQSFQLIREFFV